MLPDFVYFVVAAALALVLVTLLPFRFGRRRLRASLPAFAFFLMLFATAEAAFRVGRSQGGGPVGAAADPAIYTCSMHPQVRHQGPGLCPICHMELVPLGSGPGQGNQGGGNEITIDPVVVQNMGVRLAAVARGPLRRTVHAFGELRAAETREHDVALKIDGFIEQLFADTEGMRIERGAPLFLLYSPDLVVAQAELIAARQGGDTALLAAARTKLRLWDVADDVIDRLQQREEPERALAWPSPLAGTLMQKHIVGGAPAEKNRVLLRITDLSVLWLDAQVPSSDLGLARVGQPATAALPALPGREFSGPVVFVAPQVDRKARTASVRIELANDDGALRPGMFARVQLHTTDADAVLVPAEAVLQTGRRQLAWVAVGDGRFEPREVALGRSADGGLLEILDGLVPGEQVVVSGQFLIDAESRLREGTRKYTDEGLMRGGKLPVPPAEPLTAATQDAIDALLASYVAVAEALAQDHFDAAVWQALRAAADAAATVTEPGVQLPAAELARELQRPATDLEAERVAFKAISGAAERLFERARPRATTSALLFVHHCPMAEADWLQLDRSTRNPYYGSAMLDCGSVRRELPLPSGSGK